jgi:hypothetical protein
MKKIADASHQRSLLEFKKVTCFDRYVVLQHHIF